MPDPKNDDPIKGLNKIKESDKHSPTSDKKAKAEEEAFERGDYEQQDARENYNLRKRFKEEFADRMHWVVIPALFFGITLVLGVLFLIVKYLMMIHNSKEDISALLIYIFTHAIAVVLGVTGKFLFVGKNHH